MKSVMFLITFLMALVFGVMILIHVAEDMFGDEEHSVSIMFIALLLEAYLILTAIALYA